MVRTGLGKREGLLLWSQASLSDYLVKYLLTIPHWLSQLWSPPLSLCLMFPLLLFFGLIPFQTSYTVLISRHPSAVLGSHGQATVDYLQVCTEEGSVIFLLTHAQLREAHQWDCKCTFGEWPYLLMNMFMYLNERWCVRACVHWRQIDWLCLWIPPQDRKTF